MKFGSIINDSNGGDEWVVSGGEGVVRERVAIYSPGFVFPAFWGPNGDRKPPQ